MRIIYLSLLIFISLLISISSVSALTAGQIPSAGELISDAPSVGKASGLIDILKAIVKWTYVIFFIIAVLFLLLAAYNYLTAQGDPEKVKSVHNQLIYAAVAVAVALMAVSFDLIIRNFITSGGQGGGSGTQFWPTPQGFEQRYQPLK